MNKNLILIAIMAIFCHWVAPREDFESNIIFTDLSVGETTGFAKKYEQAGCVLRKGESAKVQCRNSPGTCKKEKECTPVTTLIYLSEEEMVDISTEHANNMLDEDYIDAEDWQSTYELAFALLLENMAAQEENP